MTKTAKRHRKAGYTDKRASQELGVKLKREARDVKNDLVDRKALAYRDNAAIPMPDHMTAWAKSIEAKGASPST